jgi:AcrR family transcriptional regulator
MARPRSAEAHRAALDATVQVLLESGVEGVTLEEVAARSGVAKSTLYRHFGSKQALVVAAARGCVVEHPTPDTGSLSTDIDFLFERYEDAEEAHHIPSLLPMLIDASMRDPELQALVTEMLDERRRPLRTVLQLAQHRGEIRDDIDLDVAISMLVGPITHRLLFDRVEVTPEFKRTVFDTVITALRLPAPAPVG